MTILGLSVEPWVIETAAIVVAGLAFTVYVVIRSRRERREEAEFQRWMRGGR